MIAGGASLFDFELHFRTRGMSESGIDFDRLAQSFGGNSAGLTAALVSTFGGDWTVAPGDQTDLAELKAEDSPLEGPGLVLKLASSAGRVLLTIPQGPLLPDWISEPSDEQQSLLNDLIVDLTQLLDLSGVDPEESTTDWTEELAEVSASFDVPQECGVLPLEAFSASDPNLAQSLYILAKRSEPVVDEEPSGQAAEQVSDAPAGVPKAEQNEAVSEKPAPVLNQETQDLIHRVRRVMPLSVKVSVRLAEKKIDLGQLINLCPGTLIMFQKSCDDLLDLYVNNKPFAQGEAVKIGEKFGLKINHVGVEKSRPPGVFTL